MAVLSFVLLSAIYVRIYREVRRVQSRIKRQDPAFVQNRRALVTTLVILTCFVLCWLPFAIYECTLMVLVQTSREYVLRNERSIRTVGTVLPVILLLNCLCDPVVYVIMIGQVRTAIKHLVTCRPTPTAAATARRRGMPPSQSKRRSPPSPGRRATPTTSASSTTPS